MPTGRIEKRYKSSYTIIIELGRDTSGKPKRITKSIKCARREEAEAEMVRMLSEIDQGRIIKPSRISTAEYLKRWLGTACHFVSPKTAERYADYIAAATAAFGLIRLQELGPLHLQAFYDGLLDSGLSAQTVLHHHRVLHTALARAVDYRLIRDNPADRVRPPKPEKPPMRILTAEQLAALLAAAQGSKYYPALYTAAYTGMRRGEILALRWSDIDLSAATISVQQTLQETEDGLFFRPPKNRSSRRRIAISDSTAALLRRHRKEQAELRLKFGPAYKDQDLVFCEHGGQPFRPDNLTTWFWKFQRAHKIEPTIRFHDLRHTHASLLLLAGWHPKVVQERLGHSSISTTMDIYSHVLPSLHRSAAASLDAIIGADPPPPQKTPK